MREPGGIHHREEVTLAALGCPYHRLEVLGQGGMGVVHRARHRETGELVALKSVASPHAASFAALRREISALTRVRHPGVVRIIAEGVTRGEPWYAMELFPGTTLRDSLREPLSLRTALTLAARIAQALGSIHAAGLVHRDLTPSNVFLRDPESPVLADFGLATRFDGSLGREIIDVGLRQTWTPLYVSPEQVRGALADARADLYSLGCILYEMLTGAPPFEGPTMSVLWAHAQRRPTVPSHLRPDVPPGVDALVFRLLEKNPRDRIGFASDVVEALVGLGADVDVVAGPTYLYRPAIVGRDAAMGHLEAKIRDLARGVGGAIFLVGESGVGKTRLALETIHAAQAQGVTVIESTCEGDVRAPGRLPGNPLLHAFAPLLLAVADRCLQHGAPETTRLLGSGATLLASYEPRLGQLPGMPGGTPAALVGDAAIRRLQVAMCATVQAFADREPLLLILDDLQWADELSLVVIDALVTLTARRGPVLLLGIYRASEASVELTQIAQKTPGERVVIDRLAPACVEAIVADMLATATPPGEMVEFLTAESEGNAFFVVEYLRAMVETGLLRRVSGEGWTAHWPAADRPLARGVLGLPGPLREVLRGRLTGLPATTRRVLDSAAVLGREIPLDLLQGMVEAAELHGTLGELFARQIVEPRGVSSVRFCHDKLREHVYAELSAEGRRAQHGSAARAIEVLLRGTPGFAPRYADLAEHWEFAGDFTRAGEYLVRAGERALAGGASRDAAERLQRARRLATRADATVTSHGLARIERLLGQARHHLGDIPGMMEACGSALARLARRDAPTPGSALVSVEPAGADLLVQTSLLAAGEALRLAGLSVAAPATGAARDLAENAALAAERLSHGYFFQQDPARLIWAALLAARFAARLGPSPELARTHATLAVACSSVPLRPVTAAYLGSAAAAVRASGDPDAAAVVEVFAGLLALCDGAFDRADGCLRRAEVVARENHDGRREREAIALQGNVAYWRGAARASLAQYERLRDVAVERGDDQALAWALSGILGCWMALGRDEDAIALYESSTVLGSEKLGRSEPLAHGNVAEAWLHLGRVAEAVTFAEGNFRRFRGEPATSFPGIYGWAGTFDAFAAGCAREPRGAPAWRHHFSRALVSARHVAAHARVFRVGRAAAARCAGVLLRLSGAEALAGRAFERSRAEAAAIGARGEEGRACVELGRGLAPGPRRDAAVSRAQTIFGDIGTGYWRREAEGLAGQRGE